MNNKLVKKLMFSLIALVIILSAYLTMNSFANSVPAEFLSSGYHLYEYDIRSKIVNGEQRYNITVNDLRREYAILCCQHGTALPSGDPIPQPAIDAGLDGESITEPISEIGKVTNSTKDFYSQYDGKVTKTAAWYKVSETKDATPEEAYILAEMVLDTQVLDLELIYYTDENGNRQEVSESEMNTVFSYEYGGQRYFLYDMKFAVLTSEGQYVVEYGGVDSGTGRTYYTYKVAAGGTDYVKYNGDLTITDPKFQIESGASYIDLDSFAYSFEGTIDEPDNLVTDGKIYITSDQAAKYDHETGKYYRAYATGGEYYVQHAWWASDANVGTKTVPNGLSKEAKAFEEYILRVTRSRSVSEVMSKYVPHEYEIELNGTVYTGTVPAAPIDYKVSYLERDVVANILNKNPEDMNQANKYGISVSFDNDNQTWLIGPIVIDYVEERVAIEGREPVEFAGITDMVLYTNKGEVPKENWRIVFLDDYRSLDDKYGYPHEQEPFYIELDYIEGAIEITDLHTTFRYMNAGGKYEKLEGVYNKITWESDYKTNRCSGPGEDPNPEDEEIPLCSHGYSVSHIESYTSWLNITKVVPTDSQLLASGLIGARWYDPAEIHMGVPILQDSIPIQKVLTSGADKNVKFEMEVYINGEYRESVWVKPNEVVYSSSYTWDDPDNPPTYEVKENLETMPDGYEYVKIENATGTLSVDTEIPTVIVTNKDTKPLKDRIPVRKELVDGSDADDKFEMKIYINGVYEESVWVKPNETAYSSYYKWYEDEPAPTYEVIENQETMPDGYKYVEIKNATGTLSANKKIPTVVAINDVEKDEASLKIIKIPEGEELQDKKYYFNVRIGNDYFDEAHGNPIEISAETGWEWISKKYEWNVNETAPTYEVSEIDPEKYYPGSGIKLKKLEPGSGSLKDKNDKNLVEVTAINHKTIETESGKLIVKKITNDPNATESFKVKGEVIVYKLDGTEEKHAIDASVTANGETTLGEYTWEKGAKAPTYVVEEDLSSMPEGWTHIETRNGTNSLNAKEPVYVEIENKTIKKLEGELYVKKVAEGTTETTDEEFNITAVISFYNANEEVTHTETVTKSVPLGGTVLIGKYEWEEGVKAPTYEVTEDTATMPAGWKFVRIDNGSDSLVANKSVTATVVNTFEGEEYFGWVNVRKECIEGKGSAITEEDANNTYNITIAVSGTFDVLDENGEVIESYVNGVRPFQATLKNGETYTTNKIRWTTSEAPTYNVTEDTTSMPEGWSLQEITNGSGSLVHEKTIKAVVTNIKQGSDIRIDLTVEMGGIVWDDSLEDSKLVEDAAGSGEGKYADGIYDSSTEFGISDVEVFVEKILYDSSDNEIGRTYATVYEEDGTPISMPIYTSRVDLGRWAAPRVELGVTKAEKEAGASYAKMNVRFRYDGQTYEPTKLLVSGSADDYYFSATGARDRYKNNSMALDIDRQEVNNRVAEIYGGNSASGNSTKGYVLGTDGEVNEVNYLTLAGNEDFMARSEVETLDSNGVAVAVFRANATTEKAGLVYPFEQLSHFLNSDNLVEIVKIIEDNVVVEVYHYVATEEYMKNINLGLVERPTADLAVAKDLVEATVVANEKMVTYRYNQILKDLSQGAKTAIESKNTVNGYEVSVYDTDYYYRAAIYEGTEAGEALEAFYGSIGKTPEDSELEVYLTYRILALNNSQGNYIAEIKELADYADKSLVLVSAEETAYIQTEVDGELIDGVVTVATTPTYTTSNGATGDVVWTETTENLPAPNSDVKAYKTNSLAGIKLARGEYVTLDITFRVDKATDADGVEDAVILGEKNNTAEIARYSTYDSEGNIEGKIDLNSAPANINFDESYFEDDTDRAPVANLGLYETQREIDGMVFEDAQTVTLNSDGYDQVVGDGIYDEDDDQVIGGIETTLVEKVVVPTDSSMENYVEYSVVWPTESTNIDGLGGHSISELTESSAGAGDGFSSVVTTNNDGVYKFNAVPAGAFAIEYKYGTGTETVAPIDNETIAVYNGQDFKTTAYQATENTDYLAADGILVNEWHDFSIGNTEDGEVIKYNDARDSEPRRLEVITKSRTIENTNAEVFASANANVPEYLNDKVEQYRDELYKEYYMIAETAKLNLEIEDITSDMVQRVLDGETVKLDGIEMKGKVIKDNPTAEETALYETAVVYQYKDIDCGIESRSTTSIALDKQIKNITLTLSDGSKVVDTNFDIEYEKDLQDDGSYRFKAKVKKDANGIGANQLQAVNKVEKKYEEVPTGYQNFRYLNVDEVIMQGATISIEYQIAALNIGEVDRIGELENLNTIEEIDEVIAKINYDSTHYAKNNRYNEVGRYLGSVYYNGANAKGNDGVVKTKVDQIIDYVDNDAVFGVLDNSKLDQSWKQVTEKELLGEVAEDGTYPNRVLAEHLLVKDGAATTIKDEDGKVYNTYTTDGKIQKGNLIVSVPNDEDGNTFTNKGFMTETTPMGYDEEGSMYMTSMKLVTTRTIASESEADDMSFDNLSEVLRFENEVGRRDILAIPGNADPSVGPFETSLAERDQSATEVVTLTPPTGADYARLITFQVLIVVLIGLVIVAVGIVVIKKKVLSK